MGNLSVRRLSMLVDDVVSVEKAAGRMRSEVKRLLGNAVLADGSVNDIAFEANCRLDVLEKTGRISRLQEAKQDIVSEWAKSPDHEVRKLAARLGDSKTLKRLAADKDFAVRAAVANRAPLSLVHEMCKKFPADDQVYFTYESRRIAEGLDDPEQKDQHLHIYDEKPIGKTAKSGPSLEMSDHWYEELARKFVMDYTNVVDTGWSLKAAKQYALGVKGSTGVDVDVKKLYDAIEARLEQRDERTLARADQKLRESFEVNVPDESFIDEDDEEEQEEFDEVKDLLAKRGTIGFMAEAKRVFAVKEVPVSENIMRLSSDRRSLVGVKVPSVGRLPSNESFRSVDERALDMYCESWNSRQKSSDEPLELSWYAHPSKPGMVGFTVRLK